MKQLAISILVLLSAPLTPAWAQSEQANPPQLFLVHRETAPLARQAEYEATAKAFVAALGEAGVGHDLVHFSALSGPELGYAYIVPLGNFAGMDDFTKNWSDVAEKVGPEKWARLAAESGAAMDHYGDTHFLLRPDLSYEPAQPRLKAGETHFIQFLFYYGVPGKEQDLEAVSREYAELFRKKGLSTRFRVYQAVSGSDLPLYVVVEGARSEADYYENAEKTRTALGEEGMKLLQKAILPIRRVESMSAIPRPDLSYPPPHGGGDD